MTSITAVDCVPYAASSRFDPADLLRPSAFPHPTNRLEMRETNISWVILTGPFAYKIKKSVHLEFIDTSSLWQRRHLCEEELRLNRRLAPDLYVDVVAITREAGGLRVGGHGRVIEYAVKMLQFEASQELSALLERGAVSQPEVVDLAQQLAEFHETAPAVSCSLGFPHTDDLHRAVLGNLAVLLSHLGAVTALPELGLLVDWTHDYLHESLVPLRRREQSGCIRECHGDLHSRNVVRWRGRLVPFDCLEFDPALRWIDVMNDVAFLVMDLRAHGREDLAFAFLNAYLERTGDFEGLRHLTFYSVYRALVRAMVDSIGADGDLGRRQEFQIRLKTRVKTAAGLISRSAPTLIIMHGASGSGKSWLSGQLASRLRAVRIRSDVERKRLSGVPASAVHGTGFAQGLYQPAISRRTYARLLECAESCLKGGINMIVDAAFLRVADRRLFRDLAMREGFRFIILACEADPATLSRRVEKRAKEHVDTSDANAEVLNRQLQNLEPLIAEEKSDVIQVDTAAPQACEDAFEAIHQRLTMNC
ncbi:MAG TPA: AAA family ATPase [Steroidobacteraceae bacterium]|nr:AAA family ATPase [Steroidobacteraceae bacterium]